MAGDQEGGAGLTTAEAEAAAALWPTLEEPLERDALIDRLAAARWPADEAFFLAVMAHDQDLAVQHAAALALVRRAHPAGPAWLLAGLQEDDEARFAAAAEALIALQGAACYPRLAAVWRDAGRDRGVRREAMRQMEAASLPQFLADITAALEAAGRDDGDRLGEAELEDALWAVAHHQHSAARPAVERLRARLAPPAGQGGAPTAQQAVVDAALGWLG